MGEVAEEFEDGLEGGDIGGRRAGFHRMVVDVSKVTGYEEVLITLAGGDSESTCEVSSRPFRAMPRD